MSGSRNWSARDTGKGKPLVMLAVLLSVWIGSRLILWESPFPISRAVADSAGQLLASTEIDTPSTIANAGEFNADAGLSIDGTTMGDDHSDGQTLLFGGSTMAPLVWDSPAAYQDESSAPVSTSGGHQLIWLAAMSHLPMPQSLESRVAGGVGPAQAAPELPGASERAQDRWSLDAWAFWRDGSSGSLVSQGRAPTYGASQAGAVLNYRLAPTNRRDPRAYVRAYRALIDNGESEVAAGVSAKPLAQLPLRAHLEVRATEFGDSIEARPAAFVTTELPVMELPLGARAEAYAQAGYVAGEAATAFADGQLHLMRDLKRFDLGRLSVGAAAWGGAQRGAHRVDVGPSVRVDLRIAETPARVSVDYRERVAGDAEPPSGVAVTLSTRF